MSVLPNVDVLQGWGRSLRLIALGCRAGGFFLPASTPASHQTLHTQRQTHSHQTLDDPTAGQPLQVQVVAPCLGSTQAADGVSSGTQRTALNMARRLGCPLIAKLSYSIVPRAEAPIQAQQCDGRVPVQAEQEAEQEAEREAEQEAEREAEQEAEREAEQEAEREAEQEAEREAEHRARVPVQPAQSKQNTEQAMGTQSNQSSQSRTLSSPWAVGTPSNQSTEAPGRWS
ncbi:hypothetical protein PMIN01_12997 [Paraphaeosphaeria minitans]|uniref:Uncharacterized protein n=1 Tax=Paraphaeosphaeria minitans TaxID=565426 RepID=A0A9P6KK04_9PLEO|nr:hypothetical protein PMIN01_12997 [Paraphaeosphaeria minitans]